MTINMTIKNKRYLFFGANRFKNYVLIILHLGITYRQVFYKHRFKTSIVIELNDLNVIFFYLVEQIMSFISHPLS